MPTRAKTPETVLDVAMYWRNLESIDCVAFLAILVLRFAYHLFTSIAILFKPHYFCLLNVH